MPDEIFYCEYDSETELFKKRKANIIDPPEDAKSHMQIEDRIEDMYFAKYTDNNNIGIFLKNNLNKIFSETHSTTSNNPAIAFHGYFESERQFLVAALEECSLVKNDIDTEITELQAELGNINATTENLKKYLSENYPALYYFEAKDGKWHFELNVHIAVDESNLPTDEKTISKYDINQTVFEKPDGTLCMYLSQNNADWFKSKIRQYNAHKIYELKEQIHKIETINKQLS